MQLRAFVHFSEQKLWQTTHVPWQQAQAGGRLLQWKQQQRRVRSTCRSKPADLQWRYPDRDGEDGNFAVTKLRHLFLSLSRRC